MSYTLNVTKWPLVLLIRRCLVWKYMQKLYLGNISVLLCYYKLTIRVRNRRYGLTFTLHSQIEKNIFCFCNLPIWFYHLSIFLAPLNQAFKLGIGWKRRGHKKDKKKSKWMCWLMDADENMKECLWIQIEKQGVHCSVL